MNQCSGSKHYIRSTISWQEGMLSVFLPYLAKARHHITERAKEKRGDTGKIESTTHALKVCEAIHGMRMTGQMKKSL